MVTDVAQRSQWRAYRKLPSLFLMVPSLTPYDLPFPVSFSGTADRTALFTIRTNPRWRPPPCWKNFKWRYLRNRSSDPLHVLF